MIQNIRLVVCLQQLPLTFVVMKSGFQHRHLSLGCSMVKAAGTSKFAPTRTAATLLPPLWSTACNQRLRRTSPWPSVTAIAIAPPRDCSLRTSKVCCLWNPTAFKALKLCFACHYSVINIYQRNANNDFATTKIPKTSSEVWTEQAKCACMVLLQIAKQLWCEHVGASISGKENRRTLTQGSGKRSPTTATVDDDSLALWPPSTLY